MACLLLLLALSSKTATARAIWEPGGGWVTPETAGDPSGDAAETPDDAADAVSDNKKKRPNGFQRTIDAMHAGVSFGVEATARRVDSFFADDRYYADTTDTYASLGAEGTWETGESNEYRARVRVRLDLPGTRERLRLFIEGGDPEDDTDSGQNSVPRAFDEPEYNIGLEAKLEDTETWDIRPGAGITAASPPDIFVRLRATRFEQLGQWLMRFSAGAAEFVDDGTEAITRLDFDRKIDDRLLFRSGTRARYRDSEDKIDVTHRFSLFHKHGHRTALAYDLGIRADDDPDWDVDQYFTQVRIRVRTYKKWFFLEATPRVFFPEDDDFEANFSFSLGFDAVFGERYR